MADSDYSVDRIKHARQRSYPLADPVIASFVVYGSEPQGLSVASRLRYRIDNSLISRLKNDVKSFRLQ